MYKYTSMEYNNSKASSSKLSETDQNNKKIKSVKVFWLEKSIEGTKILGDSHPRTHT